MSMGQQAKIQRNEETRVDLSAKTLPGQKKVNIPFAVLSMGQYSGDRDLSGEPLSKREPVRIDSNNFDEVMAGMRISLDLEVDNVLDPSSDQPLAVKYEPKSWKDLQPDGIVELVPQLKQLKELRTKLLLAKNNAADGEVAKVLMNIFKEYKDLVKE